MTLLDDIVKECLFKARGRDWLFFGNLAEYLPTVEARLGGAPSGVVQPAQGGTGQTSLNAAITAMLPSQGGNGGKVLSTNGSSLSWAEDQVAESDPIPSMVGQSGKVLGNNGTSLLWVVDQVGEGGGGDTLPPQVSHAGHFLTTDGTALSWAAVDVGDTLPAQTGQAGKFLKTDGSAISWGTPPDLGDILPSQTGNSGKFLKTDGSVTSWGTPPDLGDILPSQVGQSGKVLGTNGSVTSWVEQAIGGGSSLPTQTGNSGKILTTNGTVASWADYKPFAIDDVDGLQAAIDAKLDASLPGIPHIYFLSADVASTIITFTDVPINLPLVSGRKYQFQYILLWSSSDVANGIGISFAGPTNSLFVASVRIFGAGASGFSHTYSGTVVSFATQILAGAALAANTKYQIIVEGMIFPTADGNLYPLVRAEVATNTSTIHASSVGVLVPLT